MFFCAHTIFRTVSLTILFAVMLCVTQSVVHSGSFLSNVAEAKTAKSPYKKSFKRSQRIHSKINKKRSSSDNCVQWNANKINEKANMFKQYIDQYAQQFKVDKNLIKAVITAESCFRVKALSDKGAQGLMQLIPATAKRFGVKNSYQPKQNIRGGTRYLKFLQDRFKGDLKKVIASYNAGEGAVDKYKGIPPYQETIQYVKNVMQVYQVLNPAVNKAAVHKPPIMGLKAGRQGWRYNRSIAPHLYKQ